MEEGDSILIDYWKHRCQVELSNLAIKVYNSEKYRDLLRQMPEPEVHFDIVSRNTAGFARFPNELHLNLHFLLRDKEQFVNTVVGHEFAHLIIFYLVKKGYLPKSTPGHGRAWKDMMRFLGLDPNTYYHEAQISDEDLNLNGLPSLRKQGNKFAYTCDCEGMIHTLGAIRHKRAQAKGARRAVYNCRNCKQPIKFSHVIEASDS
ncbi:SprT family zinc-dependent metalloprotease [Psittacicella hinzii]|uniref:SprT-like domain-containing protein n=1 Tax=Psittacicella hinzii TaxID=2028575 RepID=A0A3A1YWN3_9GAMM|nr:SprT-like domain-containing protein [Psittacicella hinzii]RIY40467.1 hypothetical protein CKF58_00505 [Psittacicella hinzii]